MTSAPRLYLITPAIDDADAFADAFASACAAGDVAAVCLRLAAGDERQQVNRIKRLAPLAQEHGAAVLLAIDPQDDTDWPLIATRGGADGLHVPFLGPDAFADLRERLREGRILGAGDLRARHDAMEAGEAGADYVLFGEPRDDGSVPPLPAVTERAAWWAEIFETPCIAFAPDLESIASLARTGVEFIGLSDAVWTHAAGSDAAIRAALAAIRQAQAAQDGLAPA